MKLIFEFVFFLVGVGFFFELFFVFFCNFWGGEEGVLFGLIFKEEKFIFVLVEIFEFFDWYEIIDVVNLDFVEEVIEVFKSIFFFGNLGFKMGVLFKEVLFFLWIGIWFGDFCWECLFLYFWFGIVVIFFGVELNFDILFLVWGFLIGKVIFLFLLYDVFDFFVGLFEGDNVFFFNVVIGCGFLFFLCVFLVLVDCVNNCCIFFCCFCLEVFGCVFKFFFEDNWLFEVFYGILGMFFWVGFCNFLDIFCNFEIYVVILFFVSVVEFVIVLVFVIFIFGVIVNLFVVFGIGLLLKIFLVICWELLKVFVVLLDFVM